jgi:Holliday junction resolvase RusA-like endonuclease
MATRLAFTVPGKPVPKGRPRVVRSGGRAHAFTPKRTRDYENQCAWTAAGALAQAKAWPVSLTVPRFAVALRVFGAHGNTDMDNVAKAVLDGFEGVLYANDRQVTRLTVERCAGKGDAPRVEVVVEVIS